MKETISFRRNSSTPNDIAAHLAECDADFVPLLSGRVRIGDYAAKLAQLAERFEAWVGEELAGLVAAYCNQPENSIVHVSSVSVAPSRRGVGIGDRLIEDCLDHAKSRGFAQVELRVGQANAAARRLYERHGFRPYGNEGDEIILRRALTPEK